MNRRSVLGAAGVGIAGAGALVGTGGFSRIEAQRRVRIEAPENDEVVDDGRRGISFVAFCVDGAGDASPEEFTVTANLFKPDGDPVGLAWESPVPVQTVVLFGGGDFFNFDVDGATAGEVEMGQPGEGGRRDGQSQSNPCGFGKKLCSVKFEWDEEIPDDFSIDFPRDGCFEEP